MTFAKHRRSETGVHIRLPSPSGYRQRTYRIPRRQQQLLILLGVICIAIIRWVFFNKRMPVPMSRLKHIHRFEGIRTIRPLVDMDVVSCKVTRFRDTCSDIVPAGWELAGPDLLLGPKHKKHSKRVYLITKRQDETIDPLYSPCVQKVHIGLQQPSPVAYGEELVYWEQRPYGLWILRYTDGLSLKESNAVTRVDIIHGSDLRDYRRGWTVLPAPLDIGPETMLSVRYGRTEPDAKPRIVMPEEGKFRVLQVADLHLSTGVGICRDYKSSTRDCQADVESLNFVNQIIDEERPGLIAFTGDQVNGDSAPNAISAVLKFAQPCIERKIPFACIFGNHDDEGSLSREEMMHFIESLPYSVSEAGLEEIDGVGNYMVQVFAKPSGNDLAIGLYFLDTHKYSPDEPKFPGYDWLKPTQLLWTEWQHRLLSPWPKKSLTATFIHIPLPESRNTLPIVGEYREASTAPLYNSGFRDVLAENNIMVLTAGHDHANDFCALDRWERDNTSMCWMCQGGGVGLGGYGGYDNYIRRLRLFEFDANTQKISTWKRVFTRDTQLSKTRYDEQILVEDGQVSLSSLFNLTYAKNTKGDLIYGFHKTESSDGT